MSKKIIDRNPIHNTQSLWYNIVWSVISETIEGTFGDLLLGNHDTYHPDTYMGTPVWFNDHSLIHLYTTDHSRWQLFKTYLDINTKGAEMVSFGIFSVVLYFLERHCLRTLAMNSYQSVYKDQKNNFMIINIVNNSLNHSSI